MNTTLIAKVGWRVLQDKDSLWAKVVRSKYKVGDIRDLRWAGAKSNWSSTWRSVGIGFREVVLNGHRCVVGYGKSIRFWTYRWLAGKALTDDVVGTLPIGFENLMVKDLWRERAGWDLTRIIPWVSNEKKLELAAVMVDHFKALTIGFHGEKL